MRTHPTIIKFIMAVACFALVIMVVPAIHAQGIGGTLKDAGQGVEHGVQKGGQAVGQGAEGVYNKGKEGTEAVGHGVQNAVTPDHNQTDRNKPSQQTTTTTEQSTTTTGQTAPTTGNAATRSGGMQTQGGQHNLPRTAGELPLLILIGASCFAALGASRLARKRT